MKRWDIFKQKREKFIEYYVGLKNRKNRSKFLITAIILQRMLRYLADFYNNIRNEAVMKAVRNFTTFKIQFRLKRLIKLKG
jgi:HD superfamily phosphohydrolase YqeK